ncbi:hypothetical protein BLNAU_6172 [Blattamonas nauphoetae]|uniref:Uncharacterized protein n=1 Tax=Blattamonas nauphoetae TaxID=2049346 RepID=A0ABQ9Y5A8_9EUKA|nr:hypothetical protein BLNAU_6172 [Blattamonas nauphoetae]
MFHLLSASVFWLSLFERFQDQLASILDTQQRTNNIIGTIATIRKFDRLLKPRSIVFQAQAFLRASRQIMRSIESPVHSSPFKEIANFLTHLIQLPHLETITFQSPTVHQQYYLALSEYVSTTRPTLPRNFEKARKDASAGMKKHDPQLAAQIVDNLESSPYSSDSVIKEAIYFYRRFLSKTKNQNELTKKHQSEKEVSDLRRQLHEEAAHQSPPSITLSSNQRGRGDKPIPVSLIPSQPPPPIPQALADTK